MATFADSDTAKIPPLHQKRILAFVNEFLISTCTFLNQFAIKCEGKFIELERKMQRIEAALIILETKLASIPDDNCTTSITSAVQYNSETFKKPEGTTDERANLKVPNISKETMPMTSTPQGVRACEDNRYQKYFKMLQVGVPAAAIKLKMQNEGLQPNMLDTPDALLENGSQQSASVD